MGSKKNSHTPINELTNTEHNPLYGSKDVTPIVGKNSDFKLEVGKGNLTGYAPVFFSGYNEAVGTTEATIRPIGGKYPFPTSAAFLSIVSDNVNDTNVGTGARSVILIGLDSNYDEQSEVITLNGTTPVNTTLQYLRVNFFQILTAGTTKYNEGNIDALNGADNLSRIAISDGRALQIVATVPNGRTWFTGTFTPSAGKDDEVQVIARAFTDTGTTVVTSRTYIYQNNFPFTNLNNVPFPQKFDFEGSAVKTGSAGTARISLVTEFIEVVNTET